MRSRRSLTSLPFVVCEVGAGTLIVPDATGWAVIVYAGRCFRRARADLLSSAAVELIGANRAGLFINLVPIFGTLLLAVLILGEEFQLYHAASLVLVLGGI